MSFVLLLLIVQQEKGDFFIVKKRLQRLNKAYVPQVKNEIIAKMLVINILED